MFRLPIFLSAPMPSFSYNKLGAKTIDTYANSMLSALNDGLQIELPQLFLYRVFVKDTKTSLFQIVMLN